MNLYQISQQVNVGYDTFSDAVVCAADEADAKSIHPGGSWDDLADYYTVPAAGKLDKEYGTWTSQENVTVKLIGVADPSLPRGVVCASFHAG